MKKYIFFVSSFVLFFFNINAQQVENFQVKPLNNKINIFYDLTHEKNGQLFDVKIYCSNNEGKSFDIPVISVTGDVGTNIEGGTNKLIIWDVLNDNTNFKGKNFVFKIIATPGKIKNQTDFIESFNFELLDLYMKGNYIICALKITNNGTKRDIKLPNRLAKIYDFKGRYFEAESCKLGNKTGNNKYSTPTLTFLPGKSEYAIFRFNTYEGFKNRIKLFDIGVEVLEITYGLDLKTGNIQFKDISLEKPEIPAKAELISENMAFDLGHDMDMNKDKEPPVINILAPANKTGKPVVVNKENVIISGTIKDNSGVYSFTINGMDVQYEDNGNFETDIYLAEGDNTAFIRSTDIFQNNYETTFPIVYKPLNKEGQRQTKGNEQNQVNEIENQSKIGKYYALLIGVSKYPDPEIMNLEQPVKDADKLYSTLLENYTFEKGNIKVLKNPTREEIISELDYLNHNITEKDNLLVFYAGHGYWDKQDEIGYWLPSDAKQANTANWIRNSTIRDYLRTIKTKHTLLIADACFSGGIFKTRKAFSNASKSIQKLYEYPSRKAMTSGTLKEVPDKSVFLLYLNKRLKENIKDYISAEELFSSFKIAVLNNSPNIPQYGEIKDTGDEGGDFIFIRKN